MSRLPCRRSIVLPLSVGAASLLLATVGVVLLTSLEWSLPRALGAVGGMNVLVAICVRYIMKMRSARSAVALYALPPVGSSSPARSSASPRFCIEDFDRMFPAMPAVPTGEDAGEDLCCICLAAKAEGDPCRRLNCGHAFHAECIDDWWLRGAVNEPMCPLCRRSTFPHEVSV
eukprot:CAMPEP_0176058544 /NCGR_PEP_ID=MMETSP0120_2-20121206/29170_1 /TAXON_ID=160619 /ORGANISM="Kryptoperidinium foliaceum, Strain CCMP 1326" /LENGTH=172 /DNA_ID=CAMNT_0017392073 /DNA_START=56 /DNA_END=574 /DNA_ORIENTATION=+